MIADRLGHTSVRTVLDVYGHLLEGTDAGTAERLDSQIASYARPDGDQVKVVPIKKGRRAP